VAGRRFALGRIGESSAAQLETFSADNCLSLGLPAISYVEGIGIEEFDEFTQVSRSTSEEFVRKAGRPKVAASLLGVPALSAEAGGAVEAFTTLAPDGLFG
jgi:hypothetical protein